MNQMFVRRTGLFLGIILFLVVISFGKIDGLSTDGQITLAVFLLMGVWWATEALPLPITSLMPLVLFPLFGVEEIGVISKEFMNKVQFLFAGGFMLAIGMQKWNLHRRVALTILQYAKLTGKSIVASFMVISALLSMWVMNTSTTIMLLPIALSVCLVLCDAVKKLSDSDSAKLQISVLLGIAFSSSIGGIATPIGTGPNGFLIQFLGKEGVDIGFIDWFLIGFPVTFILIPTLWFLLTFVFFPVNFSATKEARVPIKKMLKGLGPISFEEKIVAIVFLLTALGWIFRKVLNETAIFSGLEDAVIAMVGGLSLFFFRSKSRKENLLEWKDLEDNFPWGLIFLFGGGMALAFVVSSTGLAQWLANLIPTNLNLILLMFLLITLIVFLTELTSNIATTMTFIPIIFAISLNLDINPLILTVPLTFAASCAFMLPVATPPNSIIFASKHVPIAEMVKVGFWLNLCAIAVIVLVGYYYIPVIFN